MTELKFAVLGGGSGGQATAADLAMAGNEVSLFEMEQYRAYLDPLIEIGGVNHIGIPSMPGRTGFTKIDTITTNIKEAVEDADVIKICLPAYRISYCSNHCNVFNHKELFAYHRCCGDSDFFTLSVYQLQG